MIRKYSLTSMGCKVLSFLMLMFVCFLAFIVIHYMKCENVIIDIIILFLFLLFSYAFFMVNYPRIIILNNKKIIFYVFFWFKPRKYNFSFDDINDLTLDIKMEEINVISLSTKNKIVKFTGFNSLRGYKNNLKKSKYIVNSIKEELKKYFGVSNGEY